MLWTKNGCVSRSIRTKRTEIRYFFIHNRIEKGDICLEYCHTDKMGADFMIKPLQGKHFFEFRNYFMGMPNGENISKMRKARYEIAQNEDSQNGQTAKQRESKKSKQKSNRFVSV